MSLSVVSNALIAPIASATAWGATGDKRRRAMANKQP